MKKNEKMKVKIAALFFLLMIFIVVLFAKMKEDYVPDTYDTDYVSVEEVKKELAFSVYSPEEWDDYFRTYHKEYLTKEMVYQLLEKLGVKEQIKLPGLTGQHAVTREEWTDIYEQMVDYLDMAEAVSMQTILILDQMKAADGVVLITNEGDFFTALSPGYFSTWNAYDIYVIDGACVGIKAVSKEETVVLNAYIKSFENGEVSFLYEGGDYTKTLGEQQSEVVPGVCDLVFQNGEIAKLRLKKDVIEGELLSYDEQTIEIRDYGKIKHVGKLPVYQTYGEVVEKSISDVVLGNMKVAYVNAGDEVCAILLVQPAEITDIRVLLLAEDGTKFRNEVYLRSNVEVTVHCGETKEDVQPETMLAADHYLQAQSQSTLVMEPKQEDGRIFLCDADGKAVSNGYGGSIEVRYGENGYTVVNQLPFEQYLYAVVPSEMPSNYEPEALKVQAVCARSYAYGQLLQAKLAAYGAHIDDSTSYQVYNKIPQTAESVAAVEATAGKVLKYQGNIIEAYYFSTSMGYTDTIGVWNVDDVSGYGYLQKACLTLDGVMNDLSTEQSFLEYIKTVPEGYDSNVKYYRWFAQADYQDKTEEINQILENRRSISEKNVLYYGSDGKTEQDSLRGMGSIKKLSVEERSASGSVLTLRLEYEAGIVKVKTEYNIRKILGCGVRKIVYADASESEDITMLPSAFCALEEQEDKSLMLYGGGYGHGLGMSQNAANGMAKNGMNWEDILHYFYRDVDIETMK